MSHRLPDAKWDVFISHASEDKDLFVRPLAEQLTLRGVRVWLDETELRLGDSLRRSIEDGLRQARFGIVVISPAFLAKEWPQRELDFLISGEIYGGKKVLPVWHEVDLNFVRNRAPLLADRVATSSRKGLPAVVADIMKAITDDGSETPSPAQSKAAYNLQPLDEKMLLDLMRGKPDVRWTDEVVIELISDTSTSASIRTSDIQTALASLIESGYLLKDRSGCLTVTEKTLGYYRSKNRGS